MLEAEDIREHLVEPQRGWRTAEQVVVAGEQAPRRPRIRAAVPSVNARNAERFQRDALAVEHAVEIVIRDEQQARGVLPRRVGGKPGRVGVAVRTQDGQIACAGEDPASDFAQPGVRREEPVRVQCQSLRHSTNPPVIPVRIFGPRCLS
jgi:hypothetical protein